MGGDSEQGVSEEKLLTIQECATRREVAWATIYRAVTSGIIPSTKVGRAYGIKPGDCDAFTPESAAEAGKKGAQKRWAGHEKPEEPEKPKRGRGRPRKHGNAEG